MKYEAKTDESVFDVEIEGDGSLSVDGERMEYDFRKSKDPGQYSLILGNRSYEMRISGSGEDFRVVLQGESISVHVADERSKRLAAVQTALGGASEERIIKAPMPGLVVDVLVQIGDEVMKDDTLVILESMKMHNEFKAKRDCVIKEVRVKKNDKIQQGQTLLVLE